MHDIEGEAIAGGWRALCVGVLLQGIQKAEADSKLYKPGIKTRGEGHGGVDKEVLKQRANAKKWIEGGVGIVTFEECCEAVGVDPDVTREKIKDWCNDRKRRPQFDYARSKLP